MKVKDLITHFSKIEMTPVEVDDVIALMRDNGVTSNITYWGTDIIGDILRAQVLHWEYKDEDGENVSVVDIYYSDKLPIEWQRFVCIKELLHILDPESEYVNTPEQVAHQIERIILPPDLADPVRDGNRVLCDRFANYQAAAVMIPWATRQLLKSKVDSKKLTYHDIVNMTSVPLRYVILTMSDAWDEIYPLIVDM